jgi:hypothetical protein
MVGPRKAFCYHWCYFSLLFFFSAAANSAASSSFHNDRLSSLLSPLPFSFSTTATVIMMLWWGICSLALGSIVYDNYSAVVNNIILLS